MKKRNSSEKKDSVDTFLHVRLCNKISRTVGSFWQNNIIEL